MNENAARVMYEEEYDVGMDDERYYTAAGLRFEKRKKYTYEDYIKLTEGIKLELIDGKFYEMYPLDPVTKAYSPTRRHQGLVMEIAYRIREYIGAKDGSCKVYPAPFDVVLDKDEKTVVEPDIVVICDPNKLTDNCCKGAPDWIIEIASPSNANNDYLRKLSLYKRAGVKEYWIVDPIKDKISVYRFEQHSAYPEEYTFKDKIKAGIYEDLYIDFVDIDF
mgnify:CR=1 FL=1